VAIHDAFVVKYQATTGTGDVSAVLEENSNSSSSRSSSSSREANKKGGGGGGQTYLPLHCDQSSHSFVVALNDSREYVGGGTYFPKLGTVLRPGKL
jgi:hypothetical protein